MFLLTWSYFVDVFCSENYTEILSVQLCLYVFIIQSKNIYIWYIINEIPKSLWLMQIFKVTVISRCIFCLKNIFFRSDWTSTYIHSIIKFLKKLQIPQSYISIFNTGVTIITLITHEELSISFMFVSFTFPGGNCIYYLWLFMHFSISGEDFITSSCKHYLIFKFISSSRYWYPGR